MRGDSTGDAGVGENYVIHKLPSKVQGRLGGLK